VTVGTKVIAASISSRVTFGFDISSTASVTAACHISARIVSEITSVTRTVESMTPKLDFGQKFNGLETV
jgi:hypothetical protein